MKGDEEQCDSVDNPVFRKKKSILKYIRGKIPDSYCYYYSFAYCIQKHLNKEKLFS